MAKKKLTTEEKYKKAKTKIKIKTTTKVILTVIGVAIAIPLIYYIYIGIVFYFMPRFDYDATKPMGVGYSQPLTMVNPRDKYDYTLAYYLNGKWHVVEDTEKLKEENTQKNFIVYKSSDEEVEGSQKRLYVFRDRDCIVSTPMDSFVLVHANVLGDYEKTMTMDEFEDYCDEKNFAGVFIF